MARLGVQFEYLFRMTTPLNTIFTESEAAYLRVIEGVSILGRQERNACSGLIQRDALYNYGLQEDEQVTELSWKLRRDWGQWSVGAWADR